MVWVAAPFAHRIEFRSGQPTGAISWQLLGNSGDTLVSQNFNPEPGAVSALIVVAGTYNTCVKPLFEARTLVYSYQTADAVISDRIPYRVERPVPFPVSPRGVRSKLGIEDHELPNDQIDLVSAYAEFSELFDSDTLIVQETAGDRTTILCIHAIEAFAALAALPALQLRVAQRENSGTNEFQRYTSVDWERIERDLAAHVERAKVALDPAYDETGAGSFSFGTVTRTDAVTGE